MDGATSILLRTGIGKAEKIARSLLLTLVLTVSIIALFLLMVVFAATTVATPLLVFSALVLTLFSFLLKDRVGRLGKGVRKALKRG